MYYAWKDKLDEEAERAANAQRRGSRDLTDGGASGGIGRHASSRSVGEHRQHMRRQQDVEDEEDEEDEDYEDELLHRDALPAARASAAQQKASNISVPFRARR